MRIVAGRYKGRMLDAPAGLGVRPTAERAREALFNILNHWQTPLSGARVADIFAGSGALGFEALSRGALHAVFVERDREALKILRANAAKLGAGDAATILPIDAVALPQAGAPYDFLFMDPPYRSGLAFAVLPGLMAKGWANKDSLIVVEISKDEASTLPPGFELIDDRRYGVARFLLITPAENAF